MTLNKEYLIIDSMNAIELIEKLGGTSRVAELAGVKPPSVSEWKSGNRIPRESLIFLAPIAEAAGIATRKKLLPNDWERIWPELSEKAGV